jgi:hemerythrin superfamily protein
MAKTTTKRRTTRSSTRSTTKKREDAIALLKTDHREVEAMFKRYMALGERATKSKKNIVEKLVKELSMHASVEEQVLYPAVRRELRSGERLAEEALEEHQKAKEVLAELDKMNPDDEALDDKVESLMKDIKHHVHEEESEMFPRMRKEMQAETLRDMADLMRAAKKIAPTRPHPHAPATPPGNLVAGMAAGVIDRARDVGREIMEKVKR